MREDRRMIQQPGAVAGRRRARCGRTGRRALVSAIAGVLAAVGVLILAGGSAMTVQAAGRDDPAVQAQAQAILNQMSTEEKVGQMFVVRPETISRVDPATSYGDFLPALQQYSVGGLALFSKNLQTPEQTTALTSQLQQVAGSTFHGLPYFLCVDEEGGRVTRLADNSAFGLQKMPSMQQIASSGNPTDAYNAALYIGHYLKQYGFNVDFAPDADLFLNPENTVIGDRSFGSDPAAVAAETDAYARGLHDAGILATYKHFPGHGNTAGDSHTGAVYTDKDAQGIVPELLPFQAGAVSGDADFLMVGHIETPNVTGNNLPATLQKSLVTDMIRGTWNYQGLIITDAMDMGAIVKEYGTGQAAVMAVQAGCDLVLSPDDFHAAYDAVLQAVQNGSIPMEQVNASVLRIIETKLAMQ